MLFCPSISFSFLAMKMLAKATAISVPMAVFHGFEYNEIRSVGPSHPDVIYVSLPMGVGL